MSSGSCTLQLLQLLLLLLLPLQGDSPQPLRRYKRRWVVTTLELTEEDPGPFPKLVGELFNNMYGNTSIYLISGPGVDEYPEIGLFSIEDPETGKIYVHRPIDRETTPSFMVSFDVVDRSTGTVVDESLIFNIRVSDVNDHAPQFPETEFNISVPENQAAGPPVFPMLAVDLDQENTPNSQVLYFLVSQTPSLKESSFRIDRLSGQIRLSGCLDYETAPRFTLLIRAQDCGVPVLSSTATVHVHVQDSNNHKPEFTQDQYEIQIPENQVSQGFLRLLVQDRDLPWTSAWRVQFNISEGNEEGHFDIWTDPDTNDGILSVIQPLDYEMQASHSLVIAVENQEQLFSCERGRLLWPRAAAARATVSVRVVDANDPPVFHPESFIVTQRDGARPGIRLGVFNATDADVPSQPRYKLAHDPADWVSVDENSGVVTTSKHLDRESPHVNDSFYTIVVHAVDSGLPPHTGTGTLLLFLSDINDHAPSLRPHSRFLETCESASRPLLLEAEDPDLEPYSDPFSFELDAAWGGAEGQWAVRRIQGHLAELLPPRSLPPGDYSVPLVIGDRQGLSQKQTVRVRICSCPDGSECTGQSEAGAGLLLAALFPVCAVLVALAALLFLRRGCSELGRRSHRGLIPGDDGHQTLITYNTESPAILAQGLGEMLPLTGRTLDQVPAAPQTQLACAVVFEPRGGQNMCSTPVHLAPTVPGRSLGLLEGRAMAMWSQKLCGVRVLDGADHAPDRRPHVYSEEGACGGAESLSSLSISVQELPDLLGCLGSETSPLEERDFESSVP